MLRCLDRVASLKTAAADEEADYLGRRGRGEGTGSGERKRQQERGRGSAISAWRRRNLVVEEDLKGGEGEESRDGKREWGIGSGGDGVEEESLRACWKLLRAQAYEYIYKYIKICIYI